MRCGVGAEQGGGGDITCSVGRRERRMAQQLLDRAQVAPAPSRWVAKEWRSACGVALAAGRGGRGGFCTVAGWRGLSGPPRLARNRGWAGSMTNGTGQVGVHWPRKPRAAPDHAGLGSLAGDPQQVARSGRRSASATGLGDTQPAAVEQGQHRPSRAASQLRGGIEGRSARSGGLVSVIGLGSAGSHLGPLTRARRCRRIQAPVEEAVEGAHRREGLAERAGDSARSPPADGPTPGREPRPRRPGTAPAR